MSSDESTAYRDALELVRDAHKLVERTHANVDTLARRIDTTEYQTAQKLAAVQESINTLKQWQTEERRERVNRQREMDNTMISVLDKVGQSTRAIDDLSRHWFYAGIVIGVVLVCIVVALAVLIAQVY